MGNYLYDDYEAKKKVTSDVINDWNFYTKMISNFISPKKIYMFVKIIFITIKSPAYHTKFLQTFFNNLNILEREENFEIVEDLYNDLMAKLSFHESYNNFNEKLCNIKKKIPDRSIFNHSLVRPKKEALKEFFLYVNFHRNEFEQLKRQIKLIIKEIESYPELVENDETIKKEEYEKTEENTLITYIGQMKDGIKEGKGMLVIKNRSTGDVLETYMGEFKNDKKNGLGILKKGNRQIEGSFIDNKLNGKIGLYVDNELNIIEYKNDILHGRKIVFRKGGDIVTSSFDNGHPTKKFSIYLKSSKEFFTGKKKENGNYEGIDYRGNEGTVFVGTFNSHFNLIGEGYWYQNYNGIFCNFDNGEIIPSLCYQINKYGFVYFGFCNKDGLLHGKDCIILNYSNDSEKGDLFIGTYKDGKKIGFGEYYWGDGDYMKKIYPVGWGVRYLNIDNTYLEGIMHDCGFPNGSGLLTYDGDKYSGKFFLSEEKCIFISDGRKSFNMTITDTPRFNEAVAVQFKTEVHN
jgi:hypothetical protein